MTEAPPEASIHSTTANALYVRNMCELWRRDARLAMALDALHPDDLPATESAKDGTPTIRIQNLYLHSRYRPAQEAETWAAGIKCEDKYVVIVSGFGLGYHIKALAARMPADALLIIAEPNLALLSAALRTVDLVDVLASPRVMLFTSLDRGSIVERLEPRSVLFTAGTGALFVGHTASMQLAPDFHAAFQKLVTEFVAFTRIGFVTLMLNNVTTCKNIANNLGRYVSTPPVDLLHNAYAGLPAVLVAAGPSLQKNMHLLKELLGEEEMEALRHKGTKALREEDGGTTDAPAPLSASVPPCLSAFPKSRRKAVIIAVQTMLKPLLAAGIEPDFVTSLDYNTVSTRFFENLEESGTTGRVHLVAEAKANWNVLDVFQGSMSVIHNDFAERLLRGTFPPRMGMKAGATVAHLSFYLAEFLGCNPIILTGQDLGFVDGLYYKPGTAIHETWGVELSRFNTLETKEWERIVRSRTILRKIPDIHGHPMYTEEQFFVYLQQFERDFAASRCKIIDATEGGAKKQHVHVMPLRQAIDDYCQTPMTNYASPALPPWKTWHCDTDAHLSRAVDALRERRKSADEMKQTCAATIPLLQQMIEHQADEKEMNRLFTEVDALRAKVGRDPLTFEMVCSLNTIGELRRFQADMLVKTAVKDSLDRQKRQLLRDIDYVENLKIGAERLLEVLDEALHRLDRQRDSLANHTSWPRDIAGVKK
jgi:hypothetical protein